MCCHRYISGCAGVLSLSLTVQMWRQINSLLCRLLFWACVFYISISATSAIIYIYGILVKFYAVSEAVYYNSVIFLKRKNKCIFVHIKQKTIVSIVHWCILLQNWAKIKKIGNSWKKSPDFIVYNAQRKWVLYVHYNQIGAKKEKKKHILILICKYENEQKSRK